MTENDTQAGGMYRVAWVEDDGDIFKSAWSEDRQKETDRYYELQDQENVKRVALYSKEKINQWDRPSRTETTGVEREDQ